MLNDKSSETNVWRKYIARRVRDIVSPSAAAAYEKTTPAPPLNDAHMGGFFISNRVRRN
jgi:hypothetical protein